MLKSQTIRYLCTFIQPIIKQMLFKMYVKHVIKFKTEHEKNTEYRLNKLMKSLD